MNHETKSLILLFKNMHLGWGYHNVETHGKPFISELGDVLWYVDGHWHKFADRSKPLPSLFSDFQGYNVPESHKKKKVALTVQFCFSMLEELTIYYSNHGSEVLLGLRLRKQW